ncbi:hypothetical protein [Paenibacillus sp. DMB5]|uniref:hypothetical protein n=1 Tax=Paenibacillus sp. DMB5 TaxID=1780103 RepID=UPI00076BD785|nr:hypothetical protein [Paenibacillus sp. DMB5]KUP24267.1 hypothetical protein AWJ19_13705 [Paenibacillus sp. DMB5]
MKLINKEAFILLNTKKIKTNKGEFNLYTLFDPDSFERITMLGEPDFDIPPKTKVAFEFSLREKDKSFMAFLTKIEEA